jgi:acetyl coenzyme A synthase
LSSGLPKTRSGKIVRRILKKIARDEKEIGDTTSLTEESMTIIEELFKTRHLYTF